MKEKLEKIKQQTPEHQVKLIGDMVEWLKERNKEYYELDAPTVTDSKYDGILNLLKLVEQELPHLKREDSPTQYVGGKVNELFTKVKHTIPMLSLDNAFNKEDMNKFLSKFDSNAKFIVQNKFDGMALSLHYINGKLTKAVTRGDGAIGEDVTLNAMEIDNVPKQAKTSFTGEIRGEVVMTIPEFERLNSLREKNNEKLLANPRNAAAGTMRQKDINIVKERKLMFFPYDVVNTSLETAQEVREFLKENVGFSNFPKSESIKNDIDLIMKAIEDVNKFRISCMNYRKNLIANAYDIDGAVIKLDSYSTRDNYGQTSKFPNWAIAYKFPAEEKETILKDIVPTIGRTGKVTYNAVFEPINISGAMISAASLHNAKYIRELGINIGDKVLVKKAGEIIPQVVKVSEKLSEGVFVESTICPHCNKPLQYKSGKIDQFCLSRPSECKAKLIESLSYFVSRDNMNIDGFSKQTITTLLDNNIISGIGGIFKLTEEKLLNLEGFQEKSVNNLLNAVEQARTGTELPKVISAIGVENVGKKTSKDFVKWLEEYGDVIKIVKGIDNPNIPFHEFTSKFGMVKGEALYNILPILKVFFEKVPIEPVWEYVQITRSKLTGLKTVVTGTIEGGKRDEIKNLLESYGAKVLGSVSKSTQVIFAGKKASEAKLKKAENATIINVETLKDIEEYINA